MAKFKYVNGERLQMTDAEEAKRAAEEQAWDDAAPERAFAGLRNKRDELLSQTDWWGVADQTMSDAQKKYRSDLRDLPSKYNDSSILGEITWPTKP
jgi:hypothetical protein